MGKHKIGGLSTKENNYLLECLADYRASKAKKQALEKLYKDIMGAQGFDALGRLTSHFETGLERAVWVIWDERKEGYAAHVECKEGDKITLLDEQGIKIREPITLDSRSAGWAEYFEMCAELGIDPNDDFKYFIGLTKSK
ncbi:MAG: hypothetical protein KJ955_05765 [Nanoarchaeota archaeon]|nr:hypothetical protein [Nanoarchaeota archaeon]